MKREKTPIKKRCYIFKIYQLKTKNINVIKILTKERRNRRKKVTKKLNWLFSYSKSHWKLYFTFGFKYGKKLINLSDSQYIDF